MQEGLDDPFEYLDGGVVAAVVLPPVLLVLWALLVVWVAGVLHQLKLDEEW